MNSIDPVQTLEWPLGSDHGNLAWAVGIDGDSIIVLVDTADQNENNPNTRVALLYRRSADGLMAYSRSLMQVSCASVRTARRAHHEEQPRRHQDPGPDVATVWGEKDRRQLGQATVTNGLHEPGHFAISGSTFSPAVGLRERRTHL